MKKQPAQRPQPKSRQLRRTEHTAVIGGIKVIQDGAIADDEYADWGVDIKNQTM